MRINATVDRPLNLAIERRWTIELLQRS